MKRIKKRITTWLLTLALIIGAMPIGVFASDYDNHWAENAITKWSEKGIVGGYTDGSFKPSREVTRAELAAFIVRLFGLTDTKKAKSFEDVSQQEWYASDVAKISSAGLMNVEGDRFMPDQPATREEAAYALSKAYKFSGKSSKVFKDQEEISSWAKEAVEALIAKGYISGKGADKVGPKDILTRADVIAMIDKTTAELINKAGTYTQDVSGNLVVNTRDVVLKDMIVKGNLYLAPGIGDGDITLEGITVEGKTFIEGGGINSIKSRDCKFYDSLQISANNPVRLVIQGDAVKVEALPGTTVTLTGSFKEIILTENVNMIVKDAQVENIIVQPALSGDKDAKAPSIEIAAGSTVKQVQADAPVTTTGTGKVETLIVNADGVKIEQIPTKVEVKNADIKVEVAGKVQTQATVNVAPPSGGSSGGGGGGGSSTPKQYQVTGVVTCSGEKVHYATVQIFKKVGEDIEFIQETETTKDGAYSFYVMSDQKYWLQAFIIDEKGYGYRVDQDLSVNSNTKVDLELAKSYIANITIVDANNTPVREAKIVEMDEHGNEGDSWDTDNFGFLGFFLWEGKSGNYDVYIHDIKVAQITGIVREEGYKTERLIKLDRGLSNTIEGTAVLENGQPAADRNVILEMMDRERTNTHHSQWEYVQEVRSDEAGKFTFTDIDPKENYQVFVWDETGNEIYLSKSINALVADKVKLEVKQAYVLDLEVVDESGVLISDAQIKMIRSDNQWYSTSSWEGRATRITYPEMEPGKYVIQVTIGDEVKVDELMIEKGNYYYQKTIRFPEVTSKNKVVSFAVTGQLEVLKNTLTPYEVNISKNGDDDKRWATLDENGKVEILIPENRVGDGKFVATVLDEKGVILYKEDITLTASKTDIAVDLSTLATHKLEINMVTLVTTDCAIEINEPVEPHGVFIEKEANDSFSQYVGFLSDGEGSLPEGRYWVIAFYSVEYGEYGGWTWIDLKKDITNPQIKLRPYIVNASTITVQDQEGNPLRDVCLDITNSQGKRRFVSDSNGEIDPKEVEKKSNMIISLGNGDEDRYSIEGAIDGKYSVSVDEEPLEITVTLISK